MPYRFEDHVADLYLVAEAPTREAVVVDAVAGLLEILWEVPPPQPTTFRRVEVEGSDDADRLANLLTEVLFLVDAPQGWPVAVRDAHCGDYRMSAEIGFAARDRRTPPEGREVKAASRRDLSFEPEETGGFLARVLLDL